MAQVVETKAQALAEKAVAGFMAVIRGNESGRADSSGANLFADLLEETQGALPEIERALPAPVAASKDEGAQRPNGAEPDGEATSADGYELGAAGHERSRERTAAKPLATGDSARDGEEPQNEAQESQTGEIVSEPVVVAQEDGDRQRDEDDEKTNAAIEALTAVLAVLAPFHGEIPQEVGVAQTKGMGNAGSANAQQAGEESATLNAQKTALENLKAIRQGLDSAGPDTQEDAARTKQLVDKAIGEIAGKISELHKGFQDQSLDPLGKGEAETLVHTAFAMDPAQGAADGGETMPVDAAASQETVARFSNGPLAHEGAALSEAAGQQSAMKGEPSPAVQGGFLVEKGAASREGGGNAQAPASAQGIGSGSKTVGSYDVASQLSATRAGKGGTAGLPQAIEQVAVQMHKAVKEGLDTITIQLKPAELGKIEIKLEITADKGVKGTIIAENQATLVLLQKDESSLQRALQDAGLQTQSGCLDFSLRDQGGADHYVNQRRDGNAARSEGGLAFGEDAAVSDDLSADVQETYYVTPGRVNLSV